MGDLYRLLGDAPGRNAEDLEELGEALSSLRSNYEAVLD
jgi:hypothetical protein